MKIKHHKMDPRLVSKQTWEIKYIMQKCSCPRAMILAAIKSVGHSRQKVYNNIKKQKLEQFRKIT